MKRRKKTSSKQRNRYSSNVTKEVKTKYIPLLLRYNPLRRGISLKQRFLSLVLYAFTLATIGLVSGTIFLILLFAAFSVDLPNPNRILERDAELSTKIMASDGTPIYEVFGDKHRSLIKLEDVSENIVHATMAAEDSEFYIHQGYSLRGMARAAYNTFTGGGLQGGSTITQQVVKNTLLSQERTIQRKIKEAILSLQLENRYTKDEIMQMYLNETPYGGQNYGVLTASRAYFDKHPSELSIAEAAFLAGLPQRPSYYSPFSTDPTRGLERKDYVLYLMNVRGWSGKDGKRYFLSDDDYEKAKAEVLEFKSATASFEAPHFVFYVREWLANEFGDDVVEQGGLQVLTSLDLEMQKEAEKIVRTNVEESAYLNVYNGALVAIDPTTGHIKAMVGSKDYFEDPQPAGCVSGTTGEGSCKFDPAVNVTTSPRQPGSSIKPITYATMLEQGYTAAFPFVDTPTKFTGYGVQTGKIYEPENYDGQYRGPISLRKSLGNSLNIPAVKAMKLVEIDSMIDMAEKLGITTFEERSRYGLALTLGGGETKLLEMTGAYATFANKGVYNKPTPIIEVKKSNGDILYKWVDTGGKKAIGEDVAFLIADILSDDGARSSTFGPGSTLNIPGYKVAVKTGTTDDIRDNYAMGFTPSIAVGVWVGNNNNDSLNPNLSSGISGATPIWRDFMDYFLENHEGAKEETFNNPKNVEKVEIDELTGGLPFEDNPTRSEWFIKGTEPTAKSSWYSKLEVCKEDGLLASSSCKKADKTETNTYIKITAELPEWQDDVDAWVNENYNESKYFPPQSTSGLEFDDDGDLKEDTDPKITILNYSNGDKVPLAFRLMVEVSSPNDVEKVKIYLDNEKVTEDKSVPYGYNFEFNADQLGEHEFKVVAEDEDGRDSEKKIRLVVSDEI